MTEKLEMMSFDELLAKESPESLAEIDKMYQEMSLEVIESLQLALLRQLSSISQEQLAEELGIKQSSVAALEGRGDTAKLASIKRYVEALGGQLSLQVSLPNNKMQIVFNL